MFVFIFTFIASEFVAYLAMLIFGTWPKTIFPHVLAGDAGRRHRDQRLGRAGDSVTRRCVAAFFGFHALHAAGQFMVAVADNPGLAELYGIDKRRCSC